MKLSTTHSTGSVLSYDELAVCYLVTVWYLIHKQGLANRNTIVLFDIYSTEWYCCENWGENRHSPQRKRQRICSACKIYFFDWKKYECPERVYVTYFHASSQIKPLRVKACMQMWAGRKEHKKNKVVTRHLLHFCVGHKLIRREAAVSLKRRKG